jgi:hypothetical protein
LKRIKSFHCQVEHQRLRISSRIISHRCRGRHVDGGSFAEILVVRSDGATALAGIAKSGIQRVAQASARAAQAQHVLVPGVAGALVGFLPGSRSALLRGADGAAENSVA